MTTLPVRQPADITQHFINMDAALNRESKEPARTRVETGRSIPFKGEAIYRSRGGIYPNMEKGKAFYGK